MIYKVNLFRFGDNGTSYCSVQMEEGQMGTPRISDSWDSFISGISLDLTYARLKVMGELASKGNIVRSSIPAEELLYSGVPQDAAGFQFMKNPKPISEAEFKEVIGALRGK